MTPVYAVVVSPGRTGTAWLAAVLARDPKVSARHEGRADNLRCIRAFRNDRLVLRDIKDIARRILTAGKGCAASIEVNGLIRYHAQALRREIPGLRVFYLARNGRKVVNSIYNKSLSHNSGPIIDAYGRRRDQRFAKVCRYWAVTSRVLRSTCDEVWRLEDLLADYEKFAAATEKLGASIPEAVWRAMRERRINAGRRAAEPWKLAECRIFNSLCGPEMVALRYEES